VSRTPHGPIRSSRMRWTALMLVVAGAAIGLVVAAPGFGRSQHTSSKAAPTAASKPAAFELFKRNIRDAESAFVTATGGVNGKAIPPASIKKIATFSLPAGSVGPGTTKHSVTVLCVAPSAGCTAAEHYQTAVLRSFGWTVHEVFPAGTPQGWQSAFDTAISQKVDAISAISVSPAAVKSQLDRARKLGIVTVDAAQTAAADGPGYDVYVDFRHALHKQLLAEYAIVQTNGNAHIVNITIAGIADLDVKNVANLVKTTCSKCSFQTVQMTVADVFDPVKTAGRITAILNSTPDVNYIIWPTDNAAFDAALQAIKAAGKSDKVKLVTSDANPPGMAAVQRGESPVYGMLPYQWALALAPIDGLLRKLAGKPVPDATSYGLGTHLVVKSNAPKGKMTYATICKYSLKYTDWVAPYEKAWGVKIPRPC
jgi:ABC-type sugar transport system substrate-binding protein